MSTLTSAFTRRRPVRPGARRRSPVETEVEVETGRSVPGWTVLVATALVTAALLLVGWLDDAPLSPVAVIVVLVAGLAAIVVPWWNVPAVALALVGVRLLVDGPAPAGIVLAIVLLGHLAVQLGVIAAQLTRSARVEVAVLTGSLRGFVVVQAGAQVLAAVALALRGTGLETGDAVRVVALAGAALAAALVLGRARHE
ncbi:hypothetical protein [Cellulomonas composti]|uniref:Uncharacterized protein n=1 Tax=Cellulomonas composti TaxID=266130 RepID=A0A511JDG7_9CELL|nr:hypothetical protein [Cellulomonas composti]GEL96041.1 hypothetical protein CCO02nite_26990 [Cellulomonas composti]